MTYTLKSFSSIQQINQSAWEALRADASHPFTSFDFLNLLEESGSLRAQYGWKPMHLALFDGEQMIAAAPCYLKSNSHGEFVFDWAWADAYERAGGDYYPKLLIGVPYSPITGERLLARDADAKLALIDAIVALMQQYDLSSVHVNFLTEADRISLHQRQWLMRTDTQFHWQNPGHWRSFSDMQGDMPAKKRKNISQERNKVLQSGLRIERRSGSQLSAEDWQQIHALYQSTFEYKGNTPALTRTFFERYSAVYPQRVMAVIAIDAKEEIQAMALCFQSETTLYGRYWGAKLDVPGLHFECCYYQGIEHCLANGLRYFEPGAQGEHKLARGFLPTAVHSAHWILQPQFRRAIAQHVAFETAQRLAYRESLNAHSPFKSES
jgi:uncharacterized protein